MEASRTAVARLLGRRAAAGRPLARVEAAVGALALAGVVAASWALAIGSAATERWYFVPASRSGGFPAWLAGPLHGLGAEVTPEGGAWLLVAMSACYGVALACGRTLSARATVAAVVLAHLAFLLAPPLFSADVFGYVDYARLGVVHGLSPYDHGAAAAPHDAVVPFVRWHDIRAPYGPLFLLASYPVAWLSVPAALWTLKAAFAAASLASVALVWALARERGVAPVRAVALFGLNPFLLAFAVGGAHNDVLALALLLGGVLLALRARPAAGGALVALSAGMKASAGLVLPFLLLGTAGGRRRRAVVAGALAGAAVVVALGVPAFGTDALGFVAQIVQQQHLVAFNSVPSRLSRLLGFAAIPDGVRLAFVVGLAVALAALLWRTWRGRIDWIAAAGWATLAVLVATAWLVPWYVVWVLPFAAVGRDRRLVAATLVFTVYLLATHLARQLG